MTKAVTSLALVSSLALAGCSAGSTATSGTSSTGTTYSSTVAASGTSAISYDTHYDADDLAWDESSEIEIDLDNPTATDGVTVEDGTITITAAGNYRLSGTYEGQIKIAAGDSDVVRLILENATITNDDAPALDAEEANELIICTAKGTTNTLTDGSTYTAATEEDPDAALFARVDLTLAGEGTLKVTGNYADGIATRDGLTIASGAIEVTATQHGIKGKDYVDILDGTVTVTAGTEGDGIKSTNDADAERGWVRLAGGTITIAAGDDGFKAERELEITGGSLTITDSNEGIEAQYVTVSGGTVSVTSDDDGLNATVPSTTESTENTTTTAQGSGGMGGGMMDAAVDATIYISGGELTVDVEGDGIDSNGTVSMTGGTVTVHGPSTGGNGATDAAGGFTVSGGTLAQTDAGDMFEGLEGAYARFTGLALSAGDTVTITDSSGATVAEYAAVKNAASLTVAGEKVTEGETYTVSVNGSDAGTATATSGSAGMGMGGGMAPGGMGGGMTPPGSAPGGSAVPPGSGTSTGSDSSTSTGANA